VASFQGCVGVAPGRTPFKRTRKKHLSEWRKVVALRQMHVRAARRIMHITWLWSSLRTATHPKIRTFEMKASCGGRKTANSKFNQPKPETAVPLSFLFFYCAPSWSPSNGEGKSMSRSLLLTHSNSTSASAANESPTPHTNGGPSATALRRRYKRIYQSSTGYVRCMAIHGRRDGDQQQQYWVS
jgi:hypothetical protein